MRRPVHWCSDNLLPAVAIFFVAGAWSARRFPSPPSLYPVLIAAAAIGSLGLLFLYHRRNPTGLILLLPIFFLAGYVHTARHLLPPSDPAHIYRFITQRKTVHLTGTVLDMVTWDGEKTRLTIASETLLLQEKAQAHRTHTTAFRPVHGKIRLSLRGQPTRPIRSGDRLLLMATVERIRNYRTEGSFNYQLHMAAQEIHVSGWIPSADHIWPIPTESSPMQKLKDLPGQIRRELGDFLATNLPPGPASLYQALLIGDRSRIEPDVLEHFKISGCMHLLAISGMHMGLLGLLLYGSFLWLLKRSTRLMLAFHVETLAALLTMGPLFLYALVAGMHLPVLRALIMALLLLLALVLRRQRSMIHVLAAALLVILAIQPLALFTVSFQLSFAAVLGIILAIPRLQAKLARTDHGYSRIRTWILGAFLVSCLATIVTLPIMLFHFNRISLIGPVMNLLIEPLLCLWALPIGLVAAPLIPIQADLAQSLFTLGSLGLEGARHLAAAASHIPLASVETITPSTWEIITYLAALSLFFLSWKKTWGRIGGLVLLVLVMFHFTAGLWHTKKPGYTTVAFLDVGQGSSTFIRTEDGTTLLIDCGGNHSSRFDIGERVIAPYLARQRVWRLNQLIITHPDRDHSSGAAYLLNRFRPAIIHVNTIDPGNRKSFAQALSRARERYIPITIGRKGQILLKGANTSLLCLGMNGTNALSSLSGNDMGLVLKLNHGRIGFLFPGDISVKAEKVLLADNWSGRKLSANLLLAPHHGSDSSSSGDFISRVNPRLIVVSSARTKSGRFPGHRNLRLWRREQIPLLTTGKNGTITCSTDGVWLECTTFEKKIWRLQ
ncbi:DNA internalization-related competence protein ComEC/Rec2 [Desulfolithobacter sp.]